MIFVASLIMVVFTTMLGICGIVYLLHKSIRKSSCCVCYENTPKYLKGFDLDKSKLLDKDRISPQKLDKSDLLICHRCLQGVKLL